MRWLGILLFIVSFNSLVLCGNAFAQGNAFAHGNELRGVIRNNKGAAKFGEKNGVQAFDDFTQALSDLPYSSEVHFNIGNSFLIRREFEKALSEYAQALRDAKGDSMRAREARFKALFNSGVVLTELKKIDEALESYQKALEIYPESIETKTNIELLTAGGSGDGDGEKDKKNEDKNDKKNDKGDSKEKKEDDKDGKKDDKKDGKKEEKKDEKFENPRSTPKPFKSEELSQQDVKRIMEELKRQEEQIRARMQNEQRKDAPAEKDW